MEEKFGVENIKLLLALPIELGNISCEIIEEGFSGGKSLLKFANAVGEVLDLVKVDWSALKDEYSDLSDEETLEIKSYIFEKFAISDGNLEATIENSLDLVIRLQGIIKESIALYKKKDL